jgi:hypothetical protein
MLNSPLCRSSAITSADDHELEWLFCLCTAFQAARRDLSEVAKPSQRPAVVPREARPIEYNSLTRRRAS